MSGWTTYLGLTKDKKSHAYVCTHDDCEMYFTVVLGQGEMDKRIGMQLSESVLYWLRCDVCRAYHACRVVDLRVFCSVCLERRE